MLTLNELGLTKEEFDFILYVLTTVKAQRCTVEDLPPNAPPRRFYPLDKLAV